MTHVDLAHPPTPSFRRVWYELAVPIVILAWLVSPFAVPVTIVGASLLALIPALLVWVGFRVTRGRHR